MNFDDIEEQTSKKETRYTFDDNYNEDDESLGMLSIENDITSKIKSKNFVIINGSTLIDGAGEFYIIEHKVKPISILVIIVHEEPTAIALQYGNVPTSIAVDIKKSLKRKFDYTIACEKEFSIKKVGQLIKAIEAGDNYKLLPFTMSNSNKASFSVYSGGKMSNIQSRLVTSRSVTTDINVFSIPDAKGNIIISHGYPTDSINGLVNAITALATINTDAVNFLSPSERNEMAIASPDDRFSAGVVLSPIDTPYLLSNFKMIEKYFTGVTFWGYGTININGKYVSISKVTPQVLHAMGLDALSSRLMNLLKGQRRYVKDKNQMSLIQEMLSILEDIGGAQIVSINIICGIKKQVLLENNNGVMSGNLANNDTSIYEDMRVERSRRRPPSPTEWDNLV